MVATTAASPPPARPHPRPALEWPHSYAIALWLFRLFAIFLGIWSGQSLAQLCPELSLVLRAVPATAQTAAGAIAYLEGPPLLDRSRRPSDNLRILEHLESFFPGRPLLYAHLTLEHTVGSGEDAETVIDDALTFFQPFTITQDAQNWFIAAPPQEWRSLRFAAQDITPFLKEASPNSTDLTLSAMAPDLVTVLGHVARASDGRPTLVARYPPDLQPTGPTLIGDLPFRHLRQGLVLAALAHGAVLVLFLWLLFFAPARLLTSSNALAPLRQRFEQQPGRYFVFEQTGGPEIRMIWAGILLGLVGLFLLAVRPFHQAFTNELAIAGFTLLWFQFLRWAHGIEYFYVADRDEGQLLEITRQGVRIDRQAVARLSELRLEVREQTDGDGDAYYDLIARRADQPNQPLILSDHGTRETLHTNLQAWKRFVEPSSTSAAPRQDAP